ncbi:MAG TPA: polysaccharide deacetylase family protein [Thermoanaerobaculia bacterium]
MTGPRALLAAIVLLLTFPTNAARKVSVSEQAGATVLCYHIVEGPRDPRMEISRDTFRQQMRYLEMTGYNVIPLRHLQEFVVGKRASLPKNSVVITIDDGWRSTYTEVFPELKRRKWPFTVFVYPNIIGKTANAMTWDQIREMAKAGVDIQSHTFSHAFLSRGRNRSKSEAAYTEWLQRELVKSKEVLEKETGKKVQFLAYPYGDYDQNVAEHAGKAGYSAALTCNFGKVTKGSDPLLMRRVVIDKKMDFATFRRFLGAERMVLAEVTPTPGKTVEGIVSTISAKIPNFKDVDPKSVGMAVLSLGDVLPYSYDANTGEIAVVVRDALNSVKARSHRALVWATDRKTGKRFEASWIFKLPDPDAPPPAAAPEEALPAVTASTSAPPPVVVGGGGKRK